MTKKSKPDDTISDADYYRANGWVGMGLENISLEDLIEPETDETYEDEALWQTEYDMRLPPTIRIGIADQYSFKVAASYLEPHGTEAVEQLRQTMQFFPSR